MVAGQGDSRSHPYFIIAALLAVFPPALLLLLPLDGLEGPQQLLFPQTRSVVPGGEALQQLEHLHDPRHQTHDALFPVTVDELLQLGADQLGDLVHVVDREGGKRPVEAARGAPAALHVPRGARASGFVWSSAVRA